MSIPYNFVETNVEEEHTSDTQTGLSSFKLTGLTLYVFKSIQILIDDNNDEEFNFKGEEWMTLEGGKWTRNLKLQFGSRIVG